MDERGLEAVRRRAVGAALGLAKAGQLNGSVMAAVARSARVSLSTLYEAVPSKAQLYLLIAEELQAASARAVAASAVPGESPPAATLRALRQSYTVFTESPSLAHAVILTSENLTLEERARFEGSTRVSVFGESDPFGRFSSGAEAAGRRVLAFGFLGILNARARGLIDHEDGLAALADIVDAAFATSPRHPGSAVPRHPGSAAPPHPVSAAARGG